MSDGIYADISKQCEYCHEEVSIFDALSEFGKHYHQRCYIHKTNKEIEGYRKKWIDGKLTDGDKVDLVEKYNLSQKLQVEIHVFQGMTPIVEKERCISIKEKRMLALPGGIPFVDSEGKPVFIEETTPVLSVRYVLTRPKTKTIKKKDAPKYISSHEEILQLLGGGKQLP